jgi:hypothetical protein
MLGVTAAQSSSPIPPARGWLGHRVAAGRERPGRPRILDHSPQEFQASHLVAVHEYEIHS